MQSAIESASTQLEEAINQKDKQAIEKGMQDLQTASSSFMQKVYQDANSQSGEQQPAADANQQSQGGETIDAEFNENDDQDKK